MPLRPCPGSQAFAQPHPDIVPCPGCKADVEIWSDEATGRCPACSRIVIRTESQSCVDWCRFAKECLGDQKFKEYGDMKAAMRKGTLLRRAAERLGLDSPALAASQVVLRYTEIICSREKAADPNLAAAVAITLAFTPHAAPGARPGSGEMESGWRDTVGVLLKELGYLPPFVASACAILARLVSPETGEDQPLELKILRDCIILAEAEPVLGTMDGPALSALVSRCLTEHGRAIAVEMRRFGAPAPRTVEPGPAAADPTP